MFPGPFLEALIALPAPAQQWANLFFQATQAPANTLTGLSLEDRNPQAIEQLLPFYGWLYQYYFRVQTSGWHHIPPQGPVLLVGSHNGGLAAPDMLMMTYDWFRQFGTQRLVYGLMEPKIWRFLPPLAHLATQVGAIQARPQMAIAALRRGASLLVYPGGQQDVFRPHSQRHQIHLGHTYGFIKLALQYELPIIPLISQGAHSTLFVWADLYPQIQKLRRRGLPWPTALDLGIFPLYLGLPWGLAVGPWPNIPLPLPIHTRVCPPIQFEQYGEGASRHHDYVRDCYDRVCSLMQASLDQLVKETGLFY